MDMPLPRHPWATHSGATLLALMLTLASPPAAAQGSAPPAIAPAPTTGWQPGVDVRVPLRPANPPTGSWDPVRPPPPLKGAVPERGTTNTTVIPRSSVEGRPGPGATTLMALLTEDGQSIDLGLVWRVFSAKPAADGRLPLVSEHRDASPQLRLEPGEYLVNVGYGRAFLSRRIVVAAGKAESHRFVLNAGGLRVAALLAGGEAAPDKTVAIDIFSDERDQLGQRVRVTGGIRPGTIVRLNAGIYQIVSTYGDANAVVRADVTVESGKLTEASLSHASARATFKLVGRTGGEAIADVHWEIANAQGETVKESVGALPSHILAAGTYSVVAKHAGRAFRRDFALRAGEAAEVELIEQ